MFGTHAVSFVQYDDYTTTIIGGDLGYNQPVTSDPIIGDTGEHQRRWRQRPRTAG